MNTTETKTPDLTYGNSILSLEVNRDISGVPICTVFVDGGENFALNDTELLELYSILSNNMQELQEYFTQVA